MVPVHDFKLFPQPPTGEGVEKKNIRLKLDEIRNQVKWGKCEWVLTCIILYTDSNAWKKENHSFLSACFDLYACFIKFEIP